MENPQENLCPIPDRSGYTVLKPQVTRRQLMKLAALGLATFGFASRAETAMAASKLVKVDRTSAIPLGGVKGYTLSGKYIIITQPKKDVFKGFSGNCTHQGQKLSRVSGTEIVCSAHGARFNSTSGIVTRGPATKALTVYETSVSGGFVYIKM